MGLRSRDYPMFTYGDERTISYEVGVKTSLTKTIYARVAGYLSRTQDAITSINDGCTLTNACLQGAQIFNINGGNIHARGVEAAIDGRFVAAGGKLSVSLNAGVQGAHFVSTPNLAGAPLLGSLVAQTPDLTMSAVVDYRHSLGGDVIGSINLNYTAQRGGVQDTVVTPTAPAIPMTDYDILGLQAGLTIKRLQLGIFVKNLTDTEFPALKFQQVVGGVGTVYAVRYNNPRTVGGSVSIRF